MKQISSSEFRKMFTELDEPVEVTSYGKVIGEWFPPMTRQQPIVKAVGNIPDSRQVTDWEVPFKVEYRPVPKTSKKR